MPADQVSRVLAVTTAVPEIRGLVAQPDPELVRALTKQVRGDLYRLLGQSPLNPRQFNARRYPALSVGPWLAPAGLSADTLRLVEPLTYQREGFLFFADLDLIRPQITDPDELHRLIKGLYRTSTLLVRVRVDDASQVNAIADYWGRGGRRTDLRPLLDSLARADSVDRTIDLSHLLPTFARDHLYRFPKTTMADYERPSLYNCFWSAMNFFHAQPDDRFVDSGYSLDYLQKHYRVIQADPQVGDIIALFDRNNEFFHAAVDLADGLVFGKNGQSVLAPWAITPIEHLRGHYMEKTDSWRMTYFRRNDF
jgi:hypothetical protein